MQGFSILKGILDRPFEEKYLVPNDMIFIEALFFASPTREQVERIIKHINDQMAKNRH